MQSMSHDLPNRSQPLIAISSRHLVEICKQHGRCGRLALAGGLNIARTAHAAGSDELKIALIGCGGRGTGAAGDCLDRARTSS